MGLLQHLKSYTRVSPPSDTENTYVQENSLLPNQLSSKRLPFHLLLQTKHFWKIICEWRLSSMFVYSWTASVVPNHRSAGHVLPGRTQTKTDKNRQKQAFLLFYSLSEADRCLILKTTRVSPVFHASLLIDTCRCGCETKKMTEGTSLARSVGDGRLMSSVTVICEE